MDAAPAPDPPIAWPTAILHLDLDAFFVGVYLLDHPEDRGLSIAVGGSPSGRGVVTSASYEARRFGVRSGMPMRQALRLCPRLKSARTDWERIRACSRQVMAILARFGPTEPMSVDEAYVDLGDTPCPEALAPMIRACVIEETGLAASVGLATTKLVAKVACDHGKPAGCVIVPPGEEARFLAPLPARAIPGIGPRTAERLAELDIETCGDLAAADPELLARYLGPHAAGLPRRAIGQDRRPVKSARPAPKSISNERTFGHDLSDREPLLAEVAALGAHVAARLQRHGLVGHTVHVKFRWSDFTTFTRQRALPVPTDDTGAITAVAASLWLAHWHPGRKVRLIGVGVGGLEPAGARQLTLLPTGSAPPAGTPASAPRPGSGAASPPRRPSAR